MKKEPKIAILRWETGKVPEGLMQLEALPGNSTNLDSYPFPVLLVEVKGANVDTVITNPSQKLLQDMIEISQTLVREKGIRAISTSCGFNAIFQKELAAEVSVPVFTSALLQVPFAQNLIGAHRTVGIITANKGCLTEEHFRACGITSDMNIHVVGLEELPEWNKIFDRPDEKFDLETVSDEIISTVKKTINLHPEIGAIVLECTDLPPYAQQIREAVHLPVFDFNSMMGYVALAAGEISFLSPKDL